MSAILDTVLPVFGMIVLGFGFARMGIIGAEATRGITLFVFNAAIPALLFRTVATIDGSAGAPWGLWLVFFSGLAITWIAAALVSRFIPGLAGGGGASASMAAGFGNLALLGTPLALAHFGPQAAIPLGLILSVHAPLLWFAATFHRELSRHSDTFSISGTARELLASLAGNAIVLALVAGSLWRVTGVGLNPVIDRMLAMLSDAGVPTALFALGLSLAGYSLRGAWSGVAVLLALKMALMPVLVWLACRVVPGLPADWARVAVLFAAMPTGANAFLFARRNEESVAAVSGAIALGTGLAAVTVSALFYAMDRGAL